jgi:putative modified peptide
VLEMASETELKTLGVKLVEDDAFRAAFEADPVKAAASIGVMLSADQVAMIKQAKSTAGAAGSRESKSAFIGIIYS